MYKIDHTKEQFTKFQKSLHEAVTCVGNCRVDFNVVS